MTVDEAAKAVGASCGESAAAALTGAATDSGQIKAGQLFVCVKGSRVDGHDFAPAAVKNGAAAVLASRQLPDIGVPFLVVEDTVKALGKLAMLGREKLRAKVICVTGTAGKTTLKDTLAAILREDGKTSSTLGNHNNQIGMPLAIINSAGDEKFLVLEAGISHAGDMEYLGEIAGPDMAIILNVGCGHTEGLGEKGVAWHKSRLLKYLRPGGKALVSADYPELSGEIEKLGIAPALFSINPSSHVEYSVSGGKPDEGIYKLRLGEKEYEFDTPFFGMAGAETAVAAAAAADILGIAPEKIQQGFRRVELAPQRFKLERRGNWHIFDDTYNANPLSMRRMLESASQYAKRKKLPLFAVLGEMGELGIDSAREHEQMGKQLASLNPEIIFWKGNHGDEVKKGLAAMGYAKNLIIVDNGGDIARAWREEDGLPQSGVIIFKGSRMNRLEEMAEVFKRLINGEANVL